MNQHSRRSWTEDELVEVLALYCQIPFGKMHSRNPVVVDFAGRLERTSAAVAMKLVNFASFDADLQARGIRGMGNVSRLDRQVWDRFYGHWDTLASADLSDEAVATQWPNRHTTDQRIATVRVGQRFFRNAVLSAYEDRCCITGIAEPELLRASHIIPWSVSEERRLDPANGICLNALHDAAYDRGLIAIDENMEIILGSGLNSSMSNEVFEQYFGQYERQGIEVPERFRPDTAMLRYHYSNIFVG